MNLVRAYLKAHVATVGAVTAWLVAALQDGQITGQEWGGLVVAVATGGTVAAVKNRPKKKARKAAR